MLKNADAGKCDSKENNVLVDLCVKRKLLLMYENVDPDFDALIKQWLSVFVAWWGEDDDLMRWQCPKRRVRIRHVGWNGEIRERKALSHSTLEEEEPNASVGMWRGRRKKRDIGSHMEPNVNFPRPEGSDKVLS